jgi:hypothetical protein
MVPKHAGHATEVRVDPQYSHRDASGPAAAAPHVGQFSEEGMAAKAVLRSNQMEGESMVFSS